MKMISKGLMHSYQYEDKLTRRSPINLKPDYPKILHENVPHQLK